MPSVIINSYIDNIKHSFTTPATEGKPLFWCNKTKNDMYNDDRRLQIYE